MPKCPNCGLETLRTKDWACQWCGYPLLSRSHKMIPKTYEELKQEKLYGAKPIRESEPEPVLESQEELTPESERAIEPILESEPESVLESQEEPTPESERAVEPVLESEPEPVPESQEELTPESELAVEPVLESEPESVLESQEEPTLESERAIEPVLESEPDTELVAMELTVEELLSAYAADVDTADMKFAKKLLRVTGVVAMIDVKDTLDTHYIRLTTAERNLLWNVRCIFDKKHASTLQQLAIGQTVTVQGIYNGSIIEIRMMDCVIV